MQENCLKCENKVKIFESAFNFFLSEKIFYKISKVGFQNFFKRSRDLRRVWRSSTARSERRSRKTTTKKRFYFSRKIIKSLIKLCVTNRLPSVSCLLMRSRNSCSLAFKFCLSDYSVFVFYFLFILRYYYIGPGTVDKRCQIQEVVVKRASKRI